MLSLINYLLCCVFGTFPDRMNKIFLVLVLFLVLEHSLALRCYTCSMGEDDADATCIYNPDQVTITNCQKKYCTIVRAEYKDPKGKVQSFSRSCSDLNRNEKSEDESNRYYFTSCATALCNGGSGKGGGGGKSGSLGDKSTIYCRGTGSSASGILRGPFITIIIIVPITILFCNFKLV